MCYVLCVLRSLTLWTSSDLAQKLWLQQYATSATAAAVPDFASTPASGSSGNSRFQSLALKLEESLLIVCRYVLYHITVSQLVS
jgi:hypothetical protein